MRVLSNAASVKSTKQCSRGQVCYAQQQDRKTVDKDIIAEGFEKVGFVGGEGVRVKWGVLREKIGEDEELPSVFEQIRLREEAAEDLVNIDMTERNRYAYHL